MSGAGRDGGDLTFSVFFLFIIIAHLALLTTHLFSREAEARHIQLKMSASIFILLSTVKTEGRSGWGGVVRGRGGVWDGGVGGDGFEGWMYQSSKTRLWQQTEPVVTSLRWCTMFEINRPQKCKCHSKISTCRLKSYCFWRMPCERYDQHCCGIYAMEPYTRG